MSSGNGQLFIVVQFVILGLLDVPGAKGFLPNRLTYEGTLAEDDLTHQEITEIGLTRAVARYLQNIPEEELPTADTEDPKSWFENNFQDVVNPDNFWDAVDEIVKQREHYHRRWRTDAAKNMNGERINKGSQEIAMLKGTLLASLNYDSIYSSMRVYIANALHILQMFYSNTNWVEMKGAEINKDVGIDGKLLIVADRYQATCRNCSTSGSCSGNLLVNNVLTSGYKEKQDTRKPKWDEPIYWNGKLIRVPRNSAQGKCSHGGKHDESRKSTASGGINKDSSVPEFSPHHHLHRKAVDAAIKATEYFFTDPDHGLFKMMSNKEVQDLFNIRITRGSLVFVIDVTDSMKQEINAIKDKTVEIVARTKGTRNAPSSFILSTFSDPERMTRVRQTGKADEMIRWLRDIEVSQGGDCEEYALSGLEQAIAVATPKSQLYLITDAPPKAPSKFQSVLAQALSKQIRITPILTGGCGQDMHRRRGKRNTKDNPDKYNTWYKRFQQLAEMTGGQVYATTDSRLNETLAVLEESLLESPVEVMRAGIFSNEQNYSDIFIDNTLYDVRITIGTDGKTDQMQLLSPEGVNELKNPEVTTKLQLTETMVLIKMKKPVAGIWKLVRTGTSAHEKPWFITVTGQSKMDFSARLYAVENEMKFEISGRPVAGTNISVQVKVPKVKLVSSIEQIVLYEENSIEFLSAKLKQGKKKTRQLFTASFTVPAQPFYMGIIGKDKDGNQMNRLRFTPYKPSSVELNVKPLPAVVEPKTRIRLQFSVTNAGSEADYIEISASESKHYDVHNNRQKHYVEAGQTLDSYFTLLIRKMSGVSAIITVSAQLSDSKGQAGIQYNMVDLMIRKKSDIMTTPRPVSPPSCDYLVPANDTEVCLMSFLDNACCRYRWTAIVTAEPGSVRTPIVSVYASRESTEVKEIVNDVEGKDYYQAEVTNDCCVTHEFFYIQDSNNNMATCLIQTVPPSIVNITACDLQEDEIEKTVITSSSQRTKFSSFVLVTITTLIILFTSTSRHV